MQEFRHFSYFLPLTSHLLSLTSRLLPLTFYLFSKKSELHLAASITHFCDCYLHGILGKDFLYQLGPLKEA